MNHEEIGGRIAELDSLFRSATVKTAIELDAILRELNDMASQTHHMLSGDEQASVAKIDELRHQYTAWYNAEVVRERV